MAIFDDQETALMNANTPNQQEPTKRQWTTPKVETLSLEEVVDQAEIEIAFAMTSRCCDLKP
ncbi:MAG: hypothetical protein ACR2PL_15100 [Dehalococcoidia bacterium]